MLSWYSSLFECLAALYFTMCLDEVLSKKIWTVDYYKRFTKVLTDIDEGLRMSEKVVGTLKKKVLLMQKSVTNLSIFMMSVIIGLLFLCGYETELDNKGGSLLSLHFALTVSMLACGMCATVFKRAIFGYWKRSIIVLLSTVFIFLCLFYLSPHGCFVEWLGGHSTTITVLTLVLPIVVQIIYCWAYRNLYYGYMREKVKAMIESKNKDNVDFAQEILHIAERIDAISLICSWVKHHLSSNNSR